MRLGFWIITPQTLANRKITPMQKPNRTLLEKPLKNHEVSGGHGRNYIHTENIYD
jgi:hypothetical protein